MNFVTSPLIAARAQCDKGLRGEFNVYDFALLFACIRSSVAKSAFGWLASALVLCTFSATSMRLLRGLGIASNVAFICYGMVSGLLPIIILHSVLLPMNIWRLTQLGDAAGGERTRHQRSAVLPAAAPPATECIAASTYPPRCHPHVAAS